jgi:hypothetical protein
MTSRRFPTRVIEVGRLARGLAGQGVGWIRSLAERTQSVEKKVYGIRERITQKYAHGVPSCVLGEHVFIADRRVQRTIANFNLDPDATPPVFIAGLVVNPIIIAGTTYKIPITFRPPGIFDAHHLVVGVEAGFTTFANIGRLGITPLNDYRQVLSGAGVQEGGFTSAFPATRVIRWSNQQQVLGDFAGGRVFSFLPFFWNIIDEKSGRQYAQDWMPHGALLNTRGEAAEAGGGDAFNNVQLHRDGELFEFDRAWRFERDAQVTFLFRPIMDLYQVDSGSATLPYQDVDDRTGGIREERAIVRVEFHGIRHYDEQDVLKDGARV